jgi:Tol biopolymer transport system component
VYLPGPIAPSGDRNLVMVERDGDVSALPLPAGVYRHPRVSPDGSRIAVEREEGTEANVWIYDVRAEANVRRLTFGGRNRFPIWSSDSRHIAFQSDRDGGLSIYVQLADAGGSRVERVTAAAANESHIPESWSPDGRTLLYAVRRNSQFHLFALSMVDRQSSPYGNIESAEPTGATFSPDGRWVAYSSNPVAGGVISANRGVFLQPFPATGDRFQVPRESRDFHPVWSDGGRRLIYTPSVGRFSSIEVKTTPTVQFGRATSLSISVPYDRVSTDFRDYDVFADGRLLLASPRDDQDPTGEANTSQIRIVTNWFEELSGRVPVR